MKKKIIIPAALLLFLSATAAFGQIPDSDIAEQARWEDFLRTADIIEQRQMGDEEGVTNPWQLTLSKDGVTRRALWKNPQGIQRGVLEGWKYEIAAYLLDKHFGLNMVPPTVERVFRRKAGSCQLWIPDTRDIESLLKQGQNPPAEQARDYRRALFIQQAFDNLIGNEDRNWGNLLVTSDWRVIFIDHSRTFRTTPAFKTGLPFSAEAHPDVAVMRELPRTFVEKVKALDEPTLRGVVGSYLTREEMRAVLSRRDLLVKEIDRLVQTYGEDRVFY
ncbi:MAG: phosphatidylinositol 4-kinase [Candidatus Aminicenantes bacterium]|nr:phosphatidylinositol 4-kinase [Candidatus Aminicenantes bacterium]